MSSPVVYGSAQKASQFMLDQYKQTFGRHLEQEPLEEWEARKKQHSDHGSVYRLEAESEEEYDERLSKVSSMSLPSSFHWECGLTAATEIIQLVQKS